ncbi:unnamed protein product [Lymnaea stagnalis]|uniref:Rotatin N-terminal domain-containing protein n=1 Tax=Lymnaea stagnalis TaxID=6523 RepID=A0AAV2HY47_LYMST
MTAQLRKDVDFNGLFRKLGHPLEEIRVRALENIQSKLEHQLICYADIVHEKQLYIRLLEWFNIPECSHKTEVLGILNRLAQHSAGAQLLQDMGAIEFLSQLRCDIEPCHRPIIDQILESIMLLPDTGTEQHAPECIYHRPTDSAVWGASTLTTVDASHGSHTSQSPGLRMATSMERLSQHGAQGYFAGVSSGAGHPTFGTTDYNTEAKDILSSADVRENGMSLFRLSTFPWLPLTQTDQHVIVSTNSTLQTRDSATLVGACEFLADVVFQDFPAELFLQRPEILKNLLSIISLPDPADHPIVVQACKTLTCFIKCLQVRIRYFQDPAIYTSKQDFNSSTSTLVSSSNSAGSHIVGLPVQHRHHFDWRDQRHRGDGQDGDSSTSDSRSSSVNYDPGQSNMEADLELEDEPRLQHQQLTVPQLCVALLQRALPQLQTSHESLGVQVLELVHEVLVVLGPVLDTEVWSDGRDTAREVVDHLMNCLDSISELLVYHHHSQHALTPTDTTLGDLSTHRILYMGLVNTLTRFLTIIPLEKMNSVLPEKLKLFLPTIIYDEALAMTNSRCRTICLAVAQSLGLSAPIDFQQAMDICRSLTKTCSFCLQAESGVSDVQILT